MQIEFVILFKDHDDICIDIRPILAVYWLQIREVTALKSELCCILMAAGSGSRFTGDKLAVPYLGKPLLQRALEIIPPDLFRAVAAVTRGAAALRMVRSFGFLAIENNQPELGVSHTIRLGLQALPPCRGALFLVADQPRLTRASILRIVDAWETHPDSIAAAACNDRRGNPCLFPSALFPELLALAGDVGGSRVIQAHAGLLRMVPVPADELEDADTLAALRSMEAADRIAGAEAP